MSSLTGTWRGDEVMNDDRHKINIAIDGPAGAGKSTIARLLANELGYIYVDTGAMYRVVALKVLEENLLAANDEQIARLAEHIQIELIPHEGGQQVLADGIDVTEAIRSDAVNQSVSHIAQIAQVRALLVRKQQKMAAAKGVVMDGRDIATHVLPDAELKIYLTASAEERARRRFKEMGDTELSLAELAEQIAARDQMDMQRKHAPLIVAPDAIVVDCTEMTIEQVVQHILALCRTKLK